MEVHPAYHKEKICFSTMSSQYQRLRVLTGKAGTLKTRQSDQRREGGDELKGEKSYDETKGFGGERSKSFA